MLAKTGGDCAGGVGILEKAKKAKNCCVGRFLATPISAKKQKLKSKADKSVKPLCL
jgi:hypothetical protein